MAVTRSARMLVVLQLAQRAEAAAAEALNRSRQALAQAHQQLQQVVEYESEYVTGLNTRTGQLSPRSMINDREFLAQLRRVMQTQRQRIEQLLQAEARGLQEWQLCYQRRQGIERLIEQLRVDENAVSEKRLQKEMDELSTLFDRHRVG